jgi:hypothetical protein
VEERRESSGRGCEADFVQGKRIAAGEGEKPGGERGMWEHGVKKYDRLEST